MTGVSNSGFIGECVAEGVVLPEWIDVNGHMNVAYYVLAFDLGVDALWEDLGITNEYIEDSLGSTFVIVTHSQRIAQKMDRVLQLREGKINPIDKDLII